MMRTRLLLVFLLASFARAQQTIVASYTASTAPSAASSRSPQWIGVNSGHNADPSWVAWMSRLGVNAVRSFGLNAMGTTLSSFVSHAGGTYGADLTGAPVNSVVEFEAAVAQLRSVQGRTPNAAHTWANPPAWAAFAAQMNANASTPDGGSLSATVAALVANGIETLLVFSLNCNQFSLVTMDPSNAAYWQNRWELYKHQYIAARWAYANGVRKLEFFNEPDLGEACVTTASWLDYYTLQSRAIQNSFADSNADVAEGAAECVAASCPVQPLIYASAFASATFSGSISSGGPYGLPGDGYSYFGQATVANEHAPYPAGAAVTGGVQNMNAFSLHSYGKTGYGLMQLGNGTAAGIAAARVPAAGAPATLPYTVTEHAPHTTATWTTLQTSLDDNFEASRLGAQILYQAMFGWETYIFKFSTVEQSSNIVPGCVQGTMLTNPSTACGIQKTGIHFAETSVAPYSIGDSSLGAEARARARLRVVFPTPLRPCARAPNSGGAPHHQHHGRRPRARDARRRARRQRVRRPQRQPQVPHVHDGAVRNRQQRRDAHVAVRERGTNRATPIHSFIHRITPTLPFFANQGYNPTDSVTYNQYVSYPATVTFNIAAWAVPAGVTLVHSMAAAGSMGEVAGLVANGAPSGAITAATFAGGAYATVTLALPAYSTSALVAPVVPVTEMMLAATEVTTLRAGANSLTAGSGLTVSTSTTTAHETTSVAMAKFTLPSTTVMTALLELTVASAPAQDMIMTIVGVAGGSTAGQTWHATTAAWHTAAFALTPLESGAALTSISQNFVRLDNGNAVAGHVTVAAGTPAGTVKRIDVSPYVASLGGGNATFVVARRVRTSATHGNAFATPADELSGGSTVSFSQAQLRLVQYSSVSTSATFTLGLGSAATGRRLLQAGALDLNAVQTAFANAQSGASSVAASVAGYGLSFTVTVSAPGAGASRQLSSALEQGVAATCGVRPAAISLGAVTDLGDVVTLPILVEELPTASAASACAHTLLGLKVVASDQFAAAGLAGVTTSMTTPNVAQSISVQAVVNGEPDPDQVDNMIDNSIATGGLALALAAAGVPGDVQRSGQAPPAAGGAQAPPASCSNAGALPGWGVALVGLACAAVGGGAAVALGATRYDEGKVYRGARAGNRWTNIKL